MLVNCLVRTQDGTKQMAPFLLSEQRKKGRDMQTQAESSFDLIALHYPARHPDLKFHTLLQNTLISFIRVF
jgi:hypothetical protein